MYRRILLIISLLAIQLVASQNKAMTTAEIKSFVTQVITESKSIKTLQADFTQTKSSKMLKNPAISTGKMTMQMPNILSWKYLTPSAISVISKNGQLSVNNNGKKSSFDAKSKMFEKINKLMVGSANGSMFTDPDFNIGYFKNGGKNIAVFTPKTKQLAKYLRQMALHFPNGDATVSQVKMTDAGGDETVIHFKNVKINAPIGADAFSL